MKDLGKIVLNAREILYLSALAGATEFMGIPDGFYGMDELEIKQEILKIQTALENQGYAQTDFDGNFTLNEDVMRMIQVCALCRKYISVDKINAGGNTVKLLFYFYDDKIVKVNEVCDKYELSIASSAEIKQFILEHINWVTHSTGSCTGKVIIPHSLLAQVKTEMANEFSERTGEFDLNKAGCNNAQAQIIYSGLNGTSNYYSVIIVDFDSEENDVMSIMVVNSKSGSLELIPVDVDEKEAVEFRAIDYNSFKNKLTSALALIGIVDSDGDFV